MYELTKIDIAALRQCDFVHVTLIDGVAKVRAVKRIEQSESQPFACDKEHAIAAEVTNNDIARLWKCSELVRVYRDNQDHASAVFAMLRAGDKVRFHFYPDAHTNQYLRDAGLHGDALKLIVERGAKKFWFELSSSHCPDNTARVCQSVRQQYSIVA
jgi:hypothetical protein